MTAPVAPMEARHSVTPLEALRRLIAVAKWPDAHWFSSEADWNEFQTELTVAEMVVRDYVAPVAIPDQTGDIFDLIREWAHLPEGQRGDVARSIIGHVNQAYMAGVRDTRELASLAAPVAQSAQQVEAVGQEPTGWLCQRIQQNGKVGDYWEYYDAKPAKNLMGKAGLRANDSMTNWTALYTAPQLEAQQAGDVARDVERYRWLANRVLACDYGDNDTKGRQIGWRIVHNLLAQNGRQPAFMYGKSINEAIDATMAKEKA